METILSSWAGPIIMNEVETMKTSSTQNRTGNKTSTNCLLSSPSYLRLILCMLVLAAALSLQVFAALPTVVSLQGRVSNATGGLVNNGTLVANISASADCSGTVYTETFANSIQKGVFSVLLGNTQGNELNLNYNYYLCTVVNGETIGTPQKFRGGQGQISTEDITDSYMLNTGDRGMGNFQFQFNAGADDVSIQNYSLEVIGVAPSKGVVVRKLDGDWAAHVGVANLSVFGVDNEVGIVPLAGLCRLLIRCL